jgi:predicted dehydrogenase
VKTYRGAMIGGGYASGFQLEAWAKVEGVEIVAIANRTLSKAEARAQEFGIPGVYAHYQEMLDRESLDFVDIATPPIVHLEMVTTVAQRGLPMLCQKPIAPTLGELREMMRICDEAGVRFVVHENGRFQPSWREMKRLIDAGVVGRPYYANLTSRSRSTLPVARFGVRPWFAEMPLFINYEMGVHYLDTLRYLFGEAKTVYAHMQRVSPHVAGEDLMTIMLDLNGVTAVVDMSWASVPTQTRKTETAGRGSASWGVHRIEGERGTLHLDLDARLRVITDEGEEQTQFPANGELLGYQFAQQHFIDCLRTGAPSETSGGETLKTMELVFGAYDSATHNRVYRVGQDLDRLE